MYQPKVKPLWCECGHPFLLIRQSDDQDDPGELYTHRGGGLKGFVKAAGACPDCSRACDQAWLEDCAETPPVEGGQEGWG